MDPTLPTPAPRRPDPGESSPGRLSWALQVSEARFCIVVECTGDGPALHLVLTVPAGAAAERGLRAAGWHPVGQWRWRSWGLLATVEPGPPVTPPTPPAGPNT